MISKPRFPGRLSPARFSQVQAVFLIVLLSFAAGFTMGCEKKGEGEKTPVTSSSPQLTASAERPERQIKRISAGNIPKDISPEMHSPMTQKLVLALAAQPFNSAKLARLESQTETEIIFSLPAAYPIADQVLLLFQKMLRQEYTGPFMHSARKIKNVQLTLDKTQIIFETNGQISAADDIFKIPVLSDIRPTEDSEGQAESASKKLKKDSFADYSLAELDQFAGQILLKSNKGGQDLLLVSSPCEKIQDIYPEGIDMSVLPNISYIKHWAAKQKNSAVLKSQPKNMLAMGFSEGIGPEIKAALYAAVDRDYLIDGIFAGSGELVSKPYTSLMEYRVFGTQSGAKIIPEKLSPPHAVIDVYIPVNIEWTYRLAEKFAAQALNYGLELNLKYMDFDSVIAEISKRGQDAAEAGGVAGAAGAGGEGQSGKGPFVWFFEYEFGLSPADLYGSGGRLNYGGYSSADADQIFAKMEDAAESDLPALYEEWHKIHARDLPSVPLGLYYRSYIAKKDAGLEFIYKILDIK